MPQLHRSERALKLVGDAARQQYICRTCRAHQVRAFHASYPFYAVKSERPLLQRLRESVFGASETPEERKREEARQERTKELATKFDASRPLERRKPSDRNEYYDVAAVIEPPVKGYRQALSWAGLKRVGSEEWVKAREDKGEAYTGFTPQKQLQLLNENWYSLLHNIVTEVSVLQKADRDVNQVWYPRDSAAQTFSHSSKMEVQPMEGGVELVIPQDSEEVQKILQAIPEQPDQPTEQTGARIRNLSRLLSDHPAPEDAWLQIPVDAKTKLAIAKRITQLTGRRISDPVISNATTVQDLFDAIKIKEKPKKLARTEELQTLRIELPNVEVHPKRRSVIDKEKRVGRWKVIEAELEARDLPVKGNRYPQSKTIIEPQLSRLQRKQRRMQKA
ncbi:uncharacterized protein LTR77_005640 [Saxophila tyrrhenica]|uniref:Large ribosomal subunit protein mL50 n=1 Tax=Saxophila tyrrhenica TaxID=1690608 RepID=A0AAV9P9M0_9PEZI|nr:hypothetical protein LTR77_005640 [Saxophila tyrrhenica]